MEDKLLFRVHYEDGRDYRVYLSGRIEGFPEGALVENHAFPLFAKLYPDGAMVADFIEPWLEDLYSPANRLGIDKNNGEKETLADNLRELQSKFPPGLNLASAVENKGSEDQRLFRQYILSVFIPMVVRWKKDKDLQKTTTEIFQ